MADGTTRPADLSNAVVVKYQSNYLVEAGRRTYWGTLPEWEQIQDWAGGSSFDYPMFAELDDRTVALGPDTDVVPERLEDGNMTITPNLYAGAIQLSRLLQFQARTNVQNAGAEALGANMAQSVDKLIRNGIVSGINVMRPSGVARASLTLASHAITYRFITDLVAYAKDFFIKPFLDQDGRPFFIAPVHPLVTADLQNLEEFKQVSYRMPDSLKKGYAFDIGGVAFMESQLGKLYLSGGSPNQTATTLDGAAAVDATSITLVSGTGIAIGDYLTINKGGTTEEQVLVTAGSGVTWTVSGRGKTPNTMGLRYAHATAESVTEAPNIGVMPIIGKGSIMGVYSGFYGRYGQPVLKVQGMINQFLSQAWGWYGGVGVYEKGVVMGEFAVNGGIRGYN